MSAYFHIQKMVCYKNNPLRKRKGVHFKVYQMPERRALNPFCDESPGDISRAFVLAGNHVGLFYANFRFPFCQSIYYTAVI
jgi:hypothetical protein